jgi:hypothetical protein
MLTKQMMGVIFNLSVICGTFLVWSVAQTTRWLILNGGLHKDRSKGPTPCFLKVVIDCYCLVQVGFTLRFGRAQTFFVDDESTWNPTWPK